MGSYGSSWEVAYPQTPLYLFCYFVLLSLKRESILDRGRLFCKNSELSFVEPLDKHPWLVIGAEQTTGLACSSKVPIMLVNK